MALEMFWERAAVCVGMRSEGAVCGHSPHVGLSSCCSRKKFIEPADRTKAREVHEDELIRLGVRLGKRINCISIRADIESCVVALKHGIRTLESPLPGFRVKPAVHDDRKVLHMGAKRVNEVAACPVETPLRVVAEVDEVSLHGASCLTAHSRCHRHVGIS